jgi:hypothetical protein
LRRIHGASHASRYHELGPARLPGFLRAEVSPVLFNGGPRLFDDLGDLDLQLVETLASPRTTHLRYAERKA